MELIRGHYNLRPRHRGCVATIGNFDGLHRGHRAVLGRLIDKARAFGLPSLVITFEPHPQEFFRPQQRPARLTSFREKLEILLDSGVDRVLCLRFNAALAQMPARDFVRKILVDALAVRSLSVGDDFRFGHHRSGDIALLREEGVQHGFEVLVIEALVEGGARISSTRIRELLDRGDLDGAERLLGRRYRLSGRIVKGDGRGRQIGFPTANVDLHRRAGPEDVSGGGSHCAPLSGVYAVEVSGLASRPLPGVANVGVRPTVGGRRCLLEAHLFDFDRDVYGRHVCVEFRLRLRDEQRFESVDALRAQIDVDARRARAYFGFTADSMGGRNRNVGL
jgi:riboflavin kinase / FMN adenylyltransferase